MSVNVQAEVAALKEEYKRLKAVVASILRERDDILMELVTMDSLPDETDCHSKRRQKLWVDLDGLNDALTELKAELSNLEKQLGPDEEITSRSN